MTDSPVDGGRPRAIAVVSSSRSGSTLLIKYLRQVPGAAAFGEIFREDFPHMAAWGKLSKRLDLPDDAARLHAHDLTAFWELVLSRMLARKRWVAAKIFYYHRRDDPVWGRFAAPDHRVIHLWRDSTFDQYVSRLRAIASGQWKGGAGEPDSDDASVAFDVAEYLEFREQRRLDIQATRERYSAAPGYVDIEYAELTDHAAMASTFESIFGERVELEERLSRQSTRPSIDYLADPSVAEPYAADSVRHGFVDD